ncbi:MAG TPA: hypothetical protein ENN87_00975 [Phycisphaerales bacterium]|nr:hypothetical protein [Phycisphaerales bacterium]
MNRALLVPLLIAAVAGKPAPAPDPSQEISRLRQRVEQLQAALAEKEEEIRVLKAELQARREQFVRLQEAYRKAITPDEQERREMVRRELEARRRAEEQVDQARRQASRERRERIRRNLDQRYWSNPWPNPYARPLPYRSGAYPYGYRPYGW